MISIRHLEKAYGDIKILKDVNAEINSGDVISIIGPSGTGKSTLLRCINQLDKPTGGQVFVDGVELTAKDADVLKMRLRMGMVFQQFNLFKHKMAVENLMMGPMDLLGVSKQQAFDDAVKYMKSVGLGEKLYAYPDELSGGQKQRVEIARCLAMKPEIILFDEPTSALDPTMVSEVQSVINELAKQGLTMMVVTHDMKFSREIANRIFYMDEGIIYEDGTPQQIFENPKREKTRAFVKRLRTWEYKIHSKNFDLYEMNGQMEEFALRHYLTRKQTNRLEVMMEELIINQIIKRTQDVVISVGYYEVDEKLEMHLSYGGDEFDPFNADDEDALSMLLARQYASNVKYRYTEERNILTLDIV